MMKSVLSLKCLILSIYYSSVIGTTDIEGDQSEAWEFNYKDVASWTGHVSACGGKHQSPINIDTSSGKIVIKEGVYPKLVISGYDKKAKGMQITNNDHTVVATIPEELTVTGGPVGDAKYKFLQLHFHWGSKDAEGSEHTLNNKKFAFECHFVHYNTKYKDENIAMNKTDGLLVIAVWGQISKTRNPAMGPIVQTLKRIKKGGRRANVHMKHLEIMKDFLPKGIQNYYHYNGSLTTPSCSESVTWIILHNHITMSEEQIKKFRTLEKKAGADLLSDNFRPLQPLDGRIVEWVKPKK